MAEWDTEDLDCLVRIVTEQIMPAAFPNEIFAHYSLPAFDTTGGPIAQKGSSIESGKLRLEQPAVLVSKLNPRKMRVQIFESTEGPRAVASTEFMVYVPRIEELDLHYLGHLLSSDQFARRLQAVATGTTNSRVRVKPSETLRWPVWVPPLAEQRRIAEVLDTIDETIQATERVIAKLRATVEGLIDDAVNNALSSGTVRSLGEIADGSPSSLIQTGPFGSQLHASEYVDEGIPAFMPTDIIDGDLVVSAAAKISAKKADDLGRHRLRAGDVLFARRGDLVRCAVVAAEQSGGLCGTGCLLVRIPQTALASDWLVAVYRHDVVQRRVLAQAVGSTMLNLSARLIRSLLIPLPTRASQRLMTAAHENARRIEFDRADLAKLRQIRAGLAADLLSGRVRTVTA